MKYYNLQPALLERLCEAIFSSCGFTDQESADVTDVLLTADLFGIESHGVQRLIRYFDAIREGSIDPRARALTVHETPVSKVIDAARTMGQLAAKSAMQDAIDMASERGIGMVTVHGTNHFGIAGYYALMAEKCDLMGICMTNTEAIAVPTFGRQAMLGTNPIAVAMPADPVPFLFDASTTVVTRGKLEVYNKNEQPLPQNWAADEMGQPSFDAHRVINNIIGKLGGGIYPLGGFEENSGSHKGYGLGLVVELFTAILSGGTTSPHVQKSGNADTSFFFLALDYGLFGDKKIIKGRMSQLLQELRDSPKAIGQTRIYTHGEKEFLARKENEQRGIAVNEKTLSELKFIAEQCRLDWKSFSLP